VVPSAAEDAAAAADAAAYDRHDEAVSRGEDVEDSDRRDDDEVTPPAIDLPLDHHLLPTEPAPDPDAPIEIVDTGTGRSGPIDVARGTGGARGGTRGGER
jgi:hypothetical protein